MLVEVGDYTEASINKSINNKYFMCYHQQDDPGNMFEANAKLPTGTLRDYGLGVFFAIFTKS